MSTTQRVQSLFASRRSRRAAIAGGVGVAGAAASIRFGSALAQDGTPVAVETTDKVMYLFVQAFEGGTWTPNSDGTFTLAVSGGIASTIYFSDRPERVFGASPTQHFIDALGFSPTNPPNAAIVVNADGVEDIVVVELYAPVYADGTLTYTVKVLDAYDEAGLGDAVARKPADNDLPAQFGEGAVFIDDCADGVLTCGDPSQPGTWQATSIACCYSYDACSSCDGATADWDAACQAAFGTNAAKVPEC